MQGYFDIMQCVFQNIITTTTYILERDVFRSQCQNYDPTSKNNYQTLQHLRAKHTAGGKVRELKAPALKGPLTP